MSTQETTEASQPGPSQPTPVTQTAQASGSQAARASSSQATRAPVAQTISSHVIQTVAEITPIPQSLSEITPIEEEVEIIDARTALELAPMAEFDRSPPSTMEENFTQGELTPPTVPIDDLIEQGNDNSPDVVIPMDHDMKDEKKKKGARQQEEGLNACQWMEYGLLITTVIILLLASVVGVVFWLTYYHNGYAWNENPKKQFNLHPTMMITGFITLSGFSMILYRMTRCCRHVYVKLFHTIFQALALPCIALGSIAVYESKSLWSPEPLPHFYSLHSWLGIATMGLFAIQFVFGFFSFLVLLCCEGATAACRAAFTPIHASFGITIFMLAVATSLTGLLQKISLEDNNKWYIEMQEEALVVNVLAMVLVALGIIISYLVHRVPLRANNGNVVVERL